MDFSKWLEVKEVKEWSGWNLPAGRAMWMLGKAQREGLWQGNLSRREEAGEESREPGWPEQHLLALKKSYEFSGEWYSVSAAVNYII